MEQRLVTLNKQYLCDEILSAEDLNTLVLFINNIINYINGLDSVIGSPGRDGQDGQDGLPGQDGNDGLDGHSPQISIGEDGYWYIDGHNTDVPATSPSGFDYNLAEDQAFQAALADISELKQKIQNMGTGLGSQSSYDINNIVDLVIEALRDLNWNNIINVSEWNPDMQAYLTEIGLITSDDFDGNKLKTVLQLSKIVQRLDSLETSIELNTIFTDLYGNTQSLELLKTSIAEWISNNLSLTRMLTLINDWPANGPTIYSAISETKNTVEKTEAGLQAIYQQYAGVISKEHYTTSLIEGLSNEQEARTTLSSTLGDYLFDGSGNPIYETYDAPPQNSDYVTGLYPVYETDEDGNAIPYTGIVIKYILYTTTQGLTVDDPDIADILNYIDDPQYASNMIEKTPLTNADGSVKKDLNGKVLYNTKTVNDDNGNPIKARRAFKVYYKVDPDTVEDPHSVEPYSRPGNGLYGNYDNNNSYYFIEDILLPEYDDQNNIRIRKFILLYDSDNDLYLTINHNDFSDYYISLPVDTNGNITTQSTLVNNNISNSVYVGFINNYGPNKIAYHKARKLIIRSTSGLITKNNLDEAVALLFSSNGSQTTNAFVLVMTNLELSIIDAVAEAAASLADLTQASAKLISDASMYEARTGYKDSNDYWHDIYTAEEVTLGIGTNPNPMPQTIKTKIDNNGNIVWIQDSVYTIDGKKYRYEDLIDTEFSSYITSNNRTLLWIKPDGTIGESNDSVNSLDLGWVPKKKLITQATAGIISAAYSNDFVMSLLYSKLDTKYAGISTVVTKKLSKQYNWDNSLWEYLFKYTGDTNEGEGHTLGETYWLSNTNPGNDWEPMYELDGNVTLSADQINIIGNTFIDNLNVDKIHSIWDIHPGYYHLKIDNKGFRTYFTQNENDTEEISSYSNLISMNGSGSLAKGNISWNADGTTSIQGSLTVSNTNNNSILSILIEPTNGIICKNNGNTIHRIYMNGNLELGSGSITWSNSDKLKVKGNIDATSFGILKNLNSNLYSILFTTVQSDWVNNPNNSNYKSGIAEAGFSSEEPIGIIYGIDPDTGNWAPVRFFDFAPVNKGTFNSTGEVVYVIRGANNGKVIMKYRDYPIYKVITDSNNTNNENKYISLPRSNGPLAQITENNNCYLIKTRNAVGLFPEGSEMYSGLILSGNLGSYVYSLKSVTIYLLITIIDGIKNFINNYYVIETNLVGNSVQTYVPTSLISNVNVNGIPTNSSVHPLIANTAYNTNPISTDPPVFGAIVTDPDNGAPAIQDIVRGPNN